MAPAEAKAKSSSKDKEKKEKADKVRFITQIERHVEILVAHIGSVSCLGVASGGAANSQCALVNCAC